MGTESREAMSGFLVLICKWRSNYCLIPTRINMDFYYLAYEKYILMEKMQELSKRCLGVDLGAEPTHLYAVS